MNGIEEMITALRAERDKIDAALTALAGLTASPRPTLPLVPRPRHIRIQPAQAKVARANGTKKVAAGRSTDWHAKADRMLADGKPVADVATACGVSAASIYAYRARGNTKKGAKPTPAAHAAKPNGEATRYRCQACGQYGFNPKACDHCEEKR